MDLSPIILFVYNRSSQTSITLAALAQNLLAEKSIIYIYCDGPKKGADDEELAKIEDVKNIAKNATGFKEVIVKAQSENKGLANSIIDGVTEVCNEHGSVIVLEDDLIISPFFLQYMNDALQLYKGIDKVGCISAYWYPTQEILPDTFFLKNQSCWGWGTWAKAWGDFEKDGNKLLAELNKRKLTSKFDLEGSIKYTQMLKDQISGKNNSWAIRWDAVNFINDKLCLYPGVSLVQNIGFDGSGTHSGQTNDYKVRLCDRPIDVSLLPIVENEIARNYLIQFYKKLNKKGYLQYLYEIAIKWKLIPKTKNN